MPKAVPYEESGEVTGHMVFCPACQQGHLFNTKEGNPNGVGGHKPVWTFNNDIEKPTFRASMLVRSGCKASGHKPGDECWCTYEKRYGKPSPFSCGCCHSIVTDGRIEFLGDCSHALAGQTVELPDFPAPRTEG